MPTANYKFPADFVRGAATSSYQIEGAVSEDGKGEDIWDVFTKEDHRIFEHHTGETACDHGLRCEDGRESGNDLEGRWERREWSPGPL